MVETKEDEDALVIGPPVPSIFGDSGERIMRSIKLGMDYQRRGKPQWHFKFDAPDDVDEYGQSREASMFAARTKTWRSNAKIEQCVRVALAGRPRPEKIDLRALFIGKYFRVWVGYRMTKDAGGGGKVDPELAKVNKGPDDFLRVHYLLELIDTPTEWRDPAATSAATDGSHEHVDG